MIKSRRVRWISQLARRGVKQVECNILFRKPEGMTPHGKNRRRLEDNIKMSIKGTLGEGMEWVYLAKK
jgi:hypothetical protein